MKTAINACTWSGYAHHTGTKLTVEGFFGDAAEAGYEAVEVGGGEASLGSPTACRRLVEKHGLDVAACSAAVTYNPWPPNTREYRQAIRYAAELGVDTLMVCGGFLPSPRRNTYPFDYDMFAGNLAKAMDYADRRGLTIAYHPHRGCVVETIRETREMIRRLPGLKLCVDIAHLEASGEDAIRFIRTFRKQIFYTHIKDYSWKKDSFVELGRGDGKLDVAACIRELAGLGYDGWLTVELDKKFQGSTPRTPLQSAKMCRRYLRQHGGV